MENIIQFIILILSSLTIYLLTRLDKYSKYAFIIGLICQSFWIYETLNKFQWGMFLLSLFYVYCYLKGIYKEFIKEEKDGLL